MIEGGADPTAEAARRELVLLDELLIRARMRIDTHAFHGVHWGAIVAVWYPLANALHLAGHPWWQIPLGIAAVLLGAVWSLVRERGLHRRPRTSDEDLGLTSLVRAIVCASVLGGLLVSCVGPATRWIEGQGVPIVWGLVYANIGVMIGLVHRRDYLWWGAAILAATLVAMAFSRYSGFIVGPSMAIGAIVPGVRAERRVAREALGEGAPVGRI